MPSLSTRLKLRRRPGLQRRLSLVIATAEDRLLETHARSAENFIRELAPELPFDRALDIYERLLDVPERQRRPLEIRALARLARSRPTRAAPMPTAHADRGVVESVRTRLQGRRRERLRSRIARAADNARRAVRHTYLDGAARTAAVLRPVADPAEALQIFIDALAIPPGWAERVYHDALARFPETGRAAHRGAASVEQ